MDRAIKPNLQRYTELAYELLQSGYKAVLKFLLSSQTRINRARDLINRGKKIQIYTFMFRLLWAQ